MARLQERLPGGDTIDLVLVHHRDGGLTDADRKAAGGQVAEVAEHHDLVGGTAPRGVPSRDGTTRTVAVGESLLSPGPTARLIARALRLPDAPPPGAPAPAAPAVLSESERQVLALVARGLNNAEAAQALGPSPLTTKTHVSRIMGKLGARDRAQLVIAAYETGLVTPSRS